MRIQIRLAVAMAMVCVIACTTIAGQDLAAKIEQYMQAQVKMNHFSGSILTARNGKVLFEKGYGLANIEWNILNTPKTKFRLGSITKQFTAMAIMQLQGKGLLNVQDPICKYLSNCPETWQAVKIHHLLTHTSGIPSFTEQPEYEKKMMMPCTKDEMLARFRDLPLEFQPGEKFKYDNSGYFLLGLIIEKVTKKTYGAVLQDQIFDPLEMKDSGYDFSRSILLQRASGYSMSDGKFANAAYLDMGQPYSAGALYSTVEDLLRWDQALYTEKLLPKKMMEALFTPFKENYAYGWTVQAPSPDTFFRRLISHGGGINGFSTFISHYPDDHVTVIVLSNLESTAAAPITKALSAILFGEKYELPRERVEAKVDPNIYDAYIGEYELAPDFILTVTREGSHLFTQATRQPKAEIYPESETNFFLKVVDAQVTFVKDASGKVTQLILHQGGADHPAKKK